MCNTHAMFLRPAEPADALTVARVHVRAWQVGYRHLLPAEYLDALRPEERAQRYTFGSNDPTLPFTIVATEQNEIRGFATVARSHDEDLPEFGQLAALHVDPGSWGHGVGRALLHAARTRLVEHGFHQAILWVLAGNSRAQRFYERDGWVADGQKRKESLWGVVVDDVRYRRRL
jgi:GNAT superfamily N-acetyltransferase